MNATATQHRDAMLDVFTEITRDAAQLDLQPVHVTVFAKAAGDYSVSLQIDAKNTAGVDLFAEAYGLGVDDGQRANYSREGLLDVSGYRVEVTAYCGRPVRTSPIYPAGYAPQVVEA